MVRVCDGFIGVVAVVMMPVKGQVITRLYLDSIRGWDVAHYVAAHVNRVEIFDWGVGVAASIGCSIVGRSADAFEEPLVYTVDEHTLRYKLRT